MLRACNLSKRAVIIIAFFSCSFLQVEFQNTSIAQTKKTAEDSSLLIEGEPGFEKPKVEQEEVEIEKPKISKSVELYFSSMFNLLVAGGVILVFVGIYSATKKKE